MNAKPLNRKEAILMMDPNVTPMTYEEALLAGMDVKTFTRDEVLRSARAKALVNAEEPKEMLEPTTPGDKELQ